LGSGAESQLLFDGNGYFSIKNKASGKVFGSSIDSSHVRLVQKNIISYIN
jgi:hypothetical protein